MGVHDGHRQRIRTRFLEHGLDNFEDHEALELLLSYTQPRKDVNPLAHNLIKHFGSFDAVFDAPIEELVKVDGIGESAAALIKLVPEISRRYMVRRSSLDNIIISTERAGRYVLPLFYGAKEENVYIVALDAKRKVLGQKCVFNGDVSMSMFSVRKVVEYALNSNASYVILAHNHPSGIALPSAADIDSTIKIADALEKINVRLLDHIIVADDDFVSLNDNGVIINKEN